MRKIIISLSGVVILVLSLFISNLLSESKKAPEKNDSKTVKAVYVNAVENKMIPISITSSGSIIAKERMAIYAEVQGVFMPGNRLFKAGEKYRKGETLIRINNEEFRANVIAQRSGFKSLITSILPDIKFDYTDSYNVWKTYLAAIDIQKNLPSLPEIVSEKEQNFLIGKNINVTYYNIKNLETRLRKYTITAPYSGALVEASINPGSLVSQGQKLGEYIKPNKFELELNVNANLQDFLNIGKLVTLTNIEHTETYSGTVSRINEKIDRASQTIKIFVDVLSSNLKEGEYLEATISAKETESAIEIPRTLLVNNKFIYTVENGLLHLMPVDIFYASTNTVVIKGLKDGLVYANKPVVDGYEGMKVNVIK